MELPNRRQQRKDFKEWRKELRVSETDNEGFTYTAPSRLQRISRRAIFWFVPYDISYSLDDIIGNGSTPTYMVDPPEIEDDGPSPA